MLALYARPRALIRHIDALVTKMAFVLTPTTSSLKSTKDLEGIRELLIKSVCYSSYMVLPMVITLMVFGGPILQLWMGPRYANGLIPSILAVGYLATMIQLPVLSISAGLNALGRPVIANCINSVLSVGLAYLTLGLLKGGLATTAVAITVPLTVLNAVYMPVYICRRLNLSLKTYYRETMYGPLVCVIPFGICLLGARLIFHDVPFAGLIWGGGVGGILLFTLYWLYVIPDRVKMSLLPFVRTSLKL
jgi:O-antigen/teichoic acid export membrane protein